MAYEMVMPYHLHMPSYFLETFTEYPYTYVCADLCGCMWNLLYNNYIRFKNNYANLI